MDAVRPHQNSSHKPSGSHPAPASHSQEAPSVSATTNKVAVAMETIEDTWHRTEHMSQLNGMFKSPGKLPTALGKGAGAASGLLMLGKAAHELEEGHEVEGLVEGTIGTGKLLTATGVISKKAIPVFGLAEGAFQIATAKDEKDVFLGGAKVVGTGLLLCPGTAPVGALIVVGTTVYEVIDALCEKTPQGPAQYIVRTYKTSSPSQREAQAQWEARGRKGIAPPVTAIDNTSVTVRYVEKNPDYVAPAPKTTVRDLSGRDNTRVHSVQTSLPLPPQNQAVPSFAKLTTTPKEVSALEKNLQDLQRQQNLKAASENLRLQQSRLSQYRGNDPYQLQSLKQAVAQAQQAVDAFQPKSVVFR